MLSKKYYEMIANILYEEAAEAITESEISLLSRIIDKFSTEFKLDNNKFNEKRFWEACGLRINS